MKYEIKKFHDGQVASKIIESGDLEIKIRGNSYEDLFAAASVKEAWDAANSMNKSAVSTLTIHCLIGQRSDRRFNENESFDLKVISKFINSMNFDKVMILHPHSPITLALIDNAEKISHFSFVEKAYNSIGAPVLVSPDAGAYKTTHDIALKLNADLIPSNKVRVDGAPAISVQGKVTGKECLIVDDLADGGRTFKYLAEELKKQGASKVFLYVTHAQFNYGFDELKGSIDHVYCTDSYKEIDDVFVTQYEVSQQPFQYRDLKLQVMLGFNYIKFDPMNYVIHYRNGKIVKEGKGLSFFYFNRNSSIVAIPQNSRDIPFIFKDITKDYQSVSVQGQITYCITEPLQINKQLDFTVNNDKVYLSDDYEKLTQRLVNEAQTSISSFVHNCTIKEVLSKFTEVENRLFEGLSESKVITNLGIEVMSVSVLGISADPDMARALEAETRESLQQEADKAIYDRRNFAVEQERKIKESELNTEIAIEEKQRQIVEKKMETDLAQQENDSRLKSLEMQSELEIEEMNRNLVKLKADNQREEADAKGYELEAIMKTYRDIDWRILNALNSDGGNARNNIALAFRELATNPSKIGNLNISPDLINSLLQKEQ